MRVLQWRPRTAPSTNEAALGDGRLPGSYAGRARFRPRHPEVLPLFLQPAIGRVVEVGYFGIAGPQDRFAGQALFLEWRTDEVFDGCLIPEEDLQFIPAGFELPPESPWAKRPRN
jgi:hypothetical protein